jgi:indole-3-acetate monooxygenase
MLKRVPPDQSDTVDDLTAPGDCIARARQLRPLLEAYAAKTDEMRQLAPEVVSALHGARLFRMLLPRSCDGLELDPTTYVQVIEEIAKADASVAWCMAQGSGCSMTSAYMAPHVAREVFGDPRAVLAWGPAPQKAYAVEGGYRVSGTWSFASGLMHATWVGAHCIIEEPDGSIRMDTDGKPLDLTLVMPKSSVAISDVWHTVGLRGTGSNTYAADDVFVPEAYTFTRESDRHRRETGPLYRFTTYMLFGAGFSSITLGIARAMLDTFVTSTADKLAYRQTKALRENAVIQSQVAICEAKLRSSRALLLKTLQELWDTVSNGDTVTLDQRASLRLASVHAAHQAKEVADTIYHNAGATAIFENNPFERRFRDIHTVSIQVQGSIARMQSAGQYYLGLMPSQLILVP